MPQAFDSDLVIARRKHTSRILASPLPPVPRPKLRDGNFVAVEYTSPAGKLAAYVTPSPNDSGRHPAIVWITGGDCNSVDDSSLQKGEPRSDQSASAYREAGIVMMFPSLRGGNVSRGYREGFYGEVDDILAAARRLAELHYVDPARIYLGGHSTGGTMVLLVAECSIGFRAVFSFGPVDEPRYGRIYSPFDESNADDLKLRAPIRWLDAIRTPTFVFEGGRDGNLEGLVKMQVANRNPLVKFFPLMQHDHFSGLDPVNRAAAAKILRDDGPKCNIYFDKADLR